MPTIYRHPGSDSVVELSVSNKTILRVAGVLVLVLIILWAVYTTRHTLLLIFIAFFLALALNAPVHFIARHMPGRLKGSRSLATTISYLIVVIILGGFFAYVGPPLVHQTETFVSSSPKLISEFKNQSGSVGSFIRHYHLQKEVSSLSTQLSSKAQRLSIKALPALVDVGKSLFSIIAILVLTFMMLVEGPRWAKVFRRLVPKRRQELSERLASDMYRVVRGYVNGQVMLAAIAAAFITPMLFILHISYPVALIVVVFICGLIPMVGHVIGAVIITVVALFHSFAAAIIILAYYILYIQIENYFIQPKLQANTTRMSPLLVFASLIIGINFDGLLGGLIAIPVAGCLKIFVLELLRSRNIISTPQFEEATTEQKT